MRGLVAAIYLVLAGCVTVQPPPPVAAVSPPRPKPPPTTPPPQKPPPPKMVWDRIDGQYTSGWQQQGEVDLTTCNAVAINASNQVVIPPDFYAATFELNQKACMAKHGYKLVLEAK